MVRSLVFWTFDKISSNICGHQLNCIKKKKYLESFTNYKIVIVPFCFNQSEIKNILRKNPFFEQTFSIFSQSTISGIEAGGGNQECNSKERHKSSSHWDSSREQSLHSTQNSSLLWIFLLLLEWINERQFITEKINQ